VRPAADRPALGLGGAGGGARSGGDALAAPVLVAPRPAAGDLRPGRAAALGAFAAATVLLVSVESWLPGTAAWLLALALALRDREPAFRRRMGLLLGVVAVLAAAPIETDLSWGHFLHLGGFFLAVVAGPVLVLRRTDPGLLEFRLLPRRLRWQDLVYTLISVPLAWWILELYFFRWSPGLGANWWMPADPDRGWTWRLIAGINAVGIWDELFFVNTVYAILRSVYPRRVANLGQAVVYTSVLHDMAFTGWGPPIVFAFALTQGAMYEGSRSLFWVLVVHLVVDFFLVGAILHHWYGPSITHLIF